MQHHLQECGIIYEPMIHIINSQTCSF